MRITVIAPFLEHKDGIPRVAEELLKRICEASQVESVSILARQGIDFISPSILANEKTSLVRIGRFLTARTMIELIKLYRESDIVIFFAPPWDVLDPLQALYIFSFLIKHGILPRSKWVQVVHDFIPYIFSEDGSQGTRTMKLFNTFQKHFRDIPSKYVAVSQSTKNDAMHYWNLPADRIAVIHNGPFVAPHAPRTNFGSKMILMVSDISPRKNHVRLIKAFEVVHRRYESPPELVIVGRMRTLIPELKNKVQSVIEQNKNIKITFTGYLTDSEILTLYQEADVFVYPSLYEGFGLPVLEAMACGCPVIASNVSSLPEVVDKAGILVDPYNVEELAQAMITVLEDDDLKREMSRKSIAQAQKFSWEKAAEQLLTVCVQAMQDPGPSARR